MQIKTPDHQKTLMEDQIDAMILDAVRSLLMNYRTQRLWGLGSSEQQAKSNLRKGFQKYFPSGRKRQRGKACVQEAIEKMMCY